MQAALIRPRTKIVPFDDQEILPRGWTHGVDHQHHVFFKYEATGATTWLDPRFLPHGWDQRIDSEGRVFFAYAPSEGTCWVDPRALPPNWTASLTRGSDQLVFTDTLSGFSTHIDPRCCPPGVHMRVADVSGKAYYRNDATQSTSWDDPRLSMNPQQLLALREHEWETWFEQQIKDSYARFMEENAFADIELVESQNFCQRFWLAMRVRTTVVEEDDVTAINQATGVDGVKAEFVLCIRKETFELLVASVLGIGELFQVVMACLLSFLVPTQCHFLTATGMISRTCATTDFYSTDPTLSDQKYAMFVLAFNFATLAVALIHYWWSWKREKAMVRLTESDPKVAGTRLSEMLPVYPQINNMLYLHHFRVFCSSIVFTLFFLVNSGISAYLIFKLRWAGTTSATVFLTNVGLMVKVLFKSIDQTWTGLNTKEALSIFDYRPLAFNVIDTDYVDPRDVTRGGRVDKDDEHGNPIVPDFRKLPFPVEIRHEIAQLHVAKSANAEGGPLKPVMVPVLQH